MKRVDQMLWESELAEHMSRHPDLQNLPLPAFSRRSRVGYFLILVASFIVTVVFSAIIGWYVGWYL
ncbi:MAG: hypothetical protein ACRDS1_14420 [Pseudonocardiaceae bacterium]